MRRRPAVLARRLLHAYGHAGAVTRAYDRMLRADGWALLAYEFGHPAREVERRRQRTQFWLTVLHHLQSHRTIT